MAQTAAQKAALEAQLKAAQELLAKAKTQQAATKARIEVNTLNQKQAQVTKAATAAEDAAAATASAPFTQKVGTTGKTSAQLAAELNAQQTAYDINQMGAGFKSTVNPKTGMVETTTPKVVTADVDPNKDKPGWHFNPTSGKWEIDEDLGEADPVVGVYEDPITGDIYNVHKSGKKTLLSKGTKKSDADAAAALALYNKQQAAIAKQAEDEAEKRDAFALIQDTMRSYGFTDAEMSELSGFIEKQIIDPNIGPNMAILNMRNLGVYKARFAGNESLVKAGKNALSEYDYLQQENAYDEYFKAYGVGNLSTRAQKATLIGNSVSALEVDKRLNLAVKRVKGSDPEILKQLKTYYPTITDKDLVSYFLNPEATRIDLERKVTASEISSAAVGQGFAKGTSLSALDLADYGVDRATALEGYANVAGVLPEATKLGDIYGETGIKYDQMAGEEEFLKASDAAKRKRTMLASKQRASFEGSAGNAPGAYSTSYLKKSSAAGLI